MLLSSSVRLTSWVLSETNCASHMNPTYGVGLTKLTVVCAWELPELWPESMPSVLPVKPSRPVTTDVRLMPPEDVPSRQMPNSLGHVSPDVE